MGEFRMPSLGADMDEATLLEWLVAPGDHVKRGDLMAVVDTAKAAMEIETFEPGVVGELIAQPGARLSVGDVMARIESDVTAGIETPAPVEVVPAPEPVVVAVPAAPPKAAPAVTSPIVRHLAHQRGVALETVPGSGPRGAVTREDLAHVGARRPPSSPYARKLAAELGVDLTAVDGSGPGGAVRASDLSLVAPPVRPAPAEAAAAEPVPVEKAAPVVPPVRADAMRQAIAVLMARSKKEIPHYYLSSSVDMSRATTWVRDQNGARPPSSRLVPAALLLRATAIAATKVPEVNGFWVDDHFVPGEQVHLGVAVSLRGGGLVAPAILGAEALDLETLMARMKNLVTRARAGRLRQSEMAAPTITVTNLGELGVEAVYGVIYPPQVALVGFGRIVEQPWAENGMVGVRPVVTVTLSADHRATDGHRGGQFLTAIAELLQKPEEL